MYKIAIIDDEHNILESLKKFLSRKKTYDIDTFSNPLNALEDVKKGKYNLILLDISMPQMDGINFLKEIKKSSPSTKVVMITANSTLDRAIECNSFGAENYLTKPFISLRDVENGVIK
jgi:DNA-binding NtrC family response regulator